MKPMSTPLSRRTLLRGLGTAISLPPLEAMIPIGPRAQAATRPALKFAAVYFSNGTVNVGTPGSGSNYWRCPARSETDWDLSRTLEPLADLKAYVTPVLGLYNHAHAEVEVVDGRRTPGVAHWTNPTSFLTGLPQAWSWSDPSSIVRLMRPGRSIDQEMAAKAQAQTPGGFRVPALVMGVYSTETFGSGPKGSKYLLNMISWSSQDRQTPRHATSAAVFRELFGSARPGETAEREAQRRRLRKRMVDFTREDLRALLPRLGPSDRQRMDEFITGLNDLETRIDNEGRTAPACAKPAIGSTETYTQRATNMADLMVVAFQCGLTRVSTFMLDTEHQDTSLQLTVGGVSGGHHTISHYRMNSTLSKAVAINRWQTERFAYLLRRLRDTRDIDGSSLLDNAMVLYGCGMGDGDQHNRKDIAAVLAGKGGGLPAGRCKIYADSPRHSNLLLALLHRWGVNAPSWGNSTGVLPL